MSKKKRKDPHAVALAKKRAAKLSRKRRQEIGRHAVITRWAKRKKNSGPELK